METERGRGREKMRRNYRHRSVSCRCCCCARTQHTKRVRGASMAPSMPTLAFTVAVGIGGRSGHSFQLHSPCSNRWAWGVCLPHACLAASPRRRARSAANVALAATQAQEDVGDGGGGNESESFQYLLGQTASETGGDHSEIYSPQKSLSAGYLAAVAGTSLLRAAPAEQR